MITRKELSYVNLWANRTPNPGENYCLEAMKALKKSIDLFNESYNNNKYNITFSNNEEIELEIKSRNLAHMLGIDTKNIFNDALKSFREDILNINATEHISSYELLNVISDKFEKIIEFDMREDCNIKFINYYKVLIKSRIFSKLGSLSDFKYACINFDKEEFLKNNDNKKYNSKSTKFLYLPSDEPICPYFAMGILPDVEHYIQDNNIEDDDTYMINDNDVPHIVETLIAIDNPKPFFQNQEVVIPTQILLDTNAKLNRFNADATRKKDLLKEYRNIITEYNLDNRINIYSDYFAMLSKEEEKKLSLTK